jgi:hypothetical protein
MAALKNHRHERVCREIALCFKPEDRAYEAVYGRAAPFAVWRLMRRDDIKARIAELRAEAQRDRDYREYVIQKALLPAIEANPADAYEACDLFEQGERLKPITKMDRRLTAAVTRIKVDPDTGRTVEIFFAPKIEAASVLLRACGAMTERVEHNIAPELAGRLGEALAKRAALGHGAAPRAIEAQAQPATVEAAQEFEDEV